MNLSPVKPIIVFSILLLLIDLIWLIGGKSLHQRTVMNVQKEPLSVRPLPAAIFYIIAAITFYVLVYSERDPQKYILKAMMFGLVAYGTFDFTNLAIFKNYPWGYALLDTLWGTFAITITALLVKKIF